MRFFLLTLIFASVGFSAVYFLYPRPVKSLSASTTITPTMIPTIVVSLTPTLSPTPSWKTPPELKQAIEKVLFQTKGTYGVGIKNLTTKEEYFLNEKKLFEAASLYKLWVMATVFKEIEKGNLELSQILSEDIPTLNKKFQIDAENAELTQGVVTRTVSDALEQMITVSDNYSALLLSEKIKLSTVGTFLDENGFSQSKLGEPPTTTASDMVLFFEKLFNFELSKKNTSLLMLDLLNRQKLNSKIPKYLPKNVLIEHKTGELGSFSHDAGIILTAKGEYIIVILTDTDSRKTADENIAKISQSVFDYFNPKM